MMSWINYMSCMAYEYRINEGQNYIQAESESGRIIVKMEIV